MRGHEHSNNDLSGTVHGFVVQAGSVQGGIHVSGGAAREEVPPPWQLPPSVRITDRTEELRALEVHRCRAAEDGHPTLAAVSGLGGVGKTAVALAWLHTLRPEFPGGQLYADLGAQAPDGPADPGEVVGRFLRALGVPAGQVPPALGERVALYRSLTAERRLVVLLDDAATAAQVRPLLPAGRCVTAVTSRRRMPGLSLDGGHVLHLDPLSPEAAVELLDSTLADGRVAAQPEEARALVLLCAGLPLAVRIAGARLAARPRQGITAMVRALSEEHERLEALAIEGDHDVRAALDLSYQGLPPAAARLYRLLGLHPGREFGGPVARALLGEEAVDALDALYDANLLVDVAEVSGGERYRFHDLVRLHAAARAAQDESGEERAAALLRIGHHYLANARRAEEIVEPERDSLEREFEPECVVEEDFGQRGAEAALDWLEGELPNLMAVVRIARPVGAPELAWQLTDALWPLFPRRKRYREWHEAHQEGLLAAEEAGNEEAVCRMLTSGALGKLASGAPAEGLEMFERAAASFLERGDALGHARTLNYRGLAHQRLGRPDRAAELFARAAGTLPACGDLRAGALARFNLADVAFSQGRYEEAVVDAEAARLTLEAAGDPYNAARAAGLTGRACVGLGRLGHAEAELSAALSALRAQAAEFEAARVLGGLAQLSERRGQPHQARQFYREALSLYSSVGRSGSADAEEARARLAALEPAPPTPPDTEAPEPSPSGEAQGDAGE
ncbi:ATP-binding protein [Streptomyces cyaneofuscatus]|uniref:ATP-binding protein n=1 Tax=Streptomyces TaxID=1883 RepID=UPI000978F8C2|nr:MULTISPECIES: tetratricopeptide repeat protein [unclassified Streptomyces]ONI55706.1 Regulatory protein AfsR [Streptomyces sp. IB2014 011-1]RDV53361.1 tetratricopeptide repeat protein [Streptomyces sp. IB2014 011-12]